MLIYNDEQYKKYLEEINNLMNQDPDLDTPEGERLSLLAMAVKEYEGKHFFFNKPSPIEAIRFRMEEQGLIQSDLIPYIGSKSKVSEVLSGKRSLTLSMIRALNENLEIPLDVLIQDPKNNNGELRLEDINYKEFPLNEMNIRGWVPSTKNKNEDEKKMIIAEFFKPIGGLSQQCVMWRRSLHKRDESNSKNPALMAWIAKVMMLAKQVIVGDFDKSLITANYLRELAKLSQFSQGPLLAKEMLAKNGIKLIFLKHLPKTKIDGACFLDSQDKPIIGMSLRYDRIDNFWHTLLHEMSHVYKHLTTQNQFVDNLDVESSQDPQEREADKIARESFIPRAIWLRRDFYSLHNNSEIMNLAKQLNIHPAIIAGRIRYEDRDYAKFSDLLGQGEIKNLLRDQFNE